MKKPKKIRRVKSFEMKPMFEDEAILQMETLNHDFFLFHNASNDKICLIYRRKDEELGMIISELL